MIDTTLTGGEDGGNPQAGLLAVKKGKTTWLYGITTNGGKSGNGVVLKEE